MTNNSSNKRNYKFELMKRKKLLLKMEIINVQIKDAKRNFQKKTILMKRVNIIKENLYFMI